MAKSARVKTALEKAIDKAGGVARVCVDLGIAPRTVDRWKAAKSVPGSRELVALCEKAEPDSADARWRLARRLAGLE